MNKSDTVKDVDPICVIYLHPIRVEKYVCLLVTTDIKINTQQRQYYLNEHSMTLYQYDLLRSLQGRPINIHTRDRLTTDRTCNHTQQGIKSIPYISGYCLKLLVFFTIINFYDMKKKSPNCHLFSHLACLVLFVLFHNEPSYSPYLSFFLVRHTRLLLLSYSELLYLGH